MTRLKDFRWHRPIAGAAFAALVALCAWAALPAPAEARVFVGIGVPFPAYYGPYPCCGYPPPYYAYPPPPAYYYPPPDYYPPPPAAYAPPAPSAAPAAPAASAQITYTDKPAFTNASGQTCREYRTTQTVNGTPKQVFGTACRDANGQWRVAN